MMQAPPLHGGQLRHIAERFGIPLAQLVDFSANINPDGPPLAVLSSLRASLGDPAVLNTYPDLDQSELKQAIGRFAGVSPQMITVANGFAPLLESALRLLKGKRCLLPVPSFLEYRRTLERFGVEIIPHTLTPGSSFRYDVEALLTGEHDAILLANPQNPSGVLTSQRELLSLVEAAASRRMLILLDEAFIDYAPAHTLAPDAERLPNLIVFRSVTKFLGVPGLRVGYMVAHQAMTRKLRDDIVPWPITTLAARAVAAGLADEAFAERTRLLNERRSGDLRLRLESLGIQAYPSAANFLLFRLPVPNQQSSFWQRMIVEHSLVLRDCSNYEALSQGHIRTAVRNEQENTRLAEAVGEVSLQSHSRFATW
jgi:threonine-phosphate decarboxylase